MKLLLTSAGITNTLIAEALLDLARKPAPEVTVAFIPTAANVETGNKEWMMNDSTNVRNLGVKAVDIVDISMLPIHEWKPRLEEADILCFGGGNTFHLLYWLKKSGLDSLLPELLETRVYMGISAGSMVAGSKISSSSERLLYEETETCDDAYGLGLVDFYFKPHLNSSSFPNVTPESIREFAQTVPETVYALDDECALKIIDGHGEIVGKGKFVVCNS